jgi:predicted AAA+ superfamily ATPase
LDVGLIPSIYQSDEPYEDLIAYVGNYLKEEIAAEAAVRSIPAFSRFLSIAGLSNGKLINYTNIANDAQVARTTVHEYFQILRDTLLACDLPPWRNSIKRKSLTTSKYYLFDIGVARFLQGRRGLQAGSPEFGDAFEAFIHHELKSYCDYKGQGPLNFWRSSNGDEVDFILADKTAIGVKGKPHVPDRALKGLHTLKEEGLLKKYILVCDEDKPRNKDGCALLPWREFLSNLWNDEYI